MTPDDPLLCKDCRFKLALNPEDPPSMWLCDARSRLSLLTGKVEADRVFCFSRRYNKFDPCGPEGRLWRPQEK